MANFEFAALLLVAALSVTYSAKFPPKWTKCTKNDVDCLKTAAQEAIIDLKNGNKQLHMIPLDPLHFKKMEINQGGNSPVNTNLTFYDMDLIGASRIHVNDIKFDMDNHEVNVDMKVVDGNAYLVGDYTISGSILVLPIRGEGKANITFEDAEILLKLKGSETVKEGKKYFHVDKADFEIKPKRVYFWFGNLFDGVPNLGDNMNKFLNENWEEIMGELKGSISKAMGLGMAQISNNFFSLIPVDHIMKQ